MRELPRDGETLRVAADPKLRPEEKETCLHILGDAQWADVFTRHPSAVKGLLALPEFEVEEQCTRTIRGKEVIVGVKGRLPLGSLKIGRPRRDQRLSRVFPQRRGARNNEGRRVRPSDAFATPLTGSDAEGLGQGQATQPEGKRDA